MPSFNGLYHYDVMLFCFVTEKRKTTYATDSGFATSKQRFIYMINVTINKQK